ncbi:SDR family oxidoreductase [Xanthobacteraceae bacterium Astr-EGSB]|uniref:SDR family NAD(P)-dependent oxidoreductase n=1 Tax=Astrobacterium formosum TaxID=3069710 RepID=UPI0027B5BB58|nr:SDR family oxidoreductase [Xanthobacteraceae bacterium Astr-EGSB]
MQAELSGKIAVVTGGSNGIGRATVRVLAQAGATVHVGYYKGRERAAALIADLPGKGHKAVRIVLEDTATMRTLAEEIGATHGKLDILVNSAGYTSSIAHRNLDAVDDTFFDAMMVAHVRGPFAMIRTFAPLLKASGNGVVVNISSIAGFNGAGSSIPYGAAKAALDTMSISLARVLAPQTRVICVSPGAVETDFVPGRNHAAMVKVAEASPLKRIVQPEDVAATVFACIAHLPVTTGVRIVCDAGRSLV